MIDQTVYPTNINWMVDGADVIRHTGVHSLYLLNDVEAMAYSVTALERSELRVLQEGTRNPTGNGALLTAGTGLGEGMLIHVDGRWQPSPSEGGHTDFAARTPREIELLQWLTAEYGRAHTEHIVSGPGLVNLARFTSQGRSKVLNEAEDPADLPQRVTQAALDKTCPYCVEALDLFLGVRRRVGQSRHVVHGHRRCLSRRRHPAEDSARVRQRRVHVGVSRQGADGRSDALDPGLDHPEQTGGPARRRGLRESNVSRSASISLSLIALVFTVSAGRPRADAGADPC